MFHGIARKESRYHKGKPKTVYLVDVNNISQLLSSKFYILPKKHLTIHGYHSDYMKLVSHNTNVNFKTSGIHSSFKERFLKRQNNLCPHCNESPLDSEGLYENQNLHIHHINPIYRGGTSNKISNIVLLHSWCHRDINHKNFGD